MSIVVSQYCDNFCISPISIESTIQLAMYL